MRREKGHSKSTKAARKETAASGLDSLLKGVVRREFDQVVVWSIDRRGSSLQDLIAVLNELRQKRCDLYVHRQALDTTTASGQMLFGGACRFLGV